MRGVIVRRLALLLPVLFVILFAVFLLQTALPGDPAAIIAGPEANKEIVEGVRVSLGLDKPIWEQFGTFMGDVLRGDFGISYRSGRPVSDMIEGALPVTGSLALVTSVLTLLIGVPLGIVAALKRGRLADRLVSGYSAVAIAVPPFVFGFVLVIVLALNAAWFPATGYKTLADGPDQWLEHLVLPSLAFALPLAAEIARQVRGSFAEILGRDFIRTARASGLSPISIVGKHAAKTAAIPVITVFGLQAGRILGGAVVVEQVFGLPGLGSLAYEAVSGRDLPLIRGVVIVSAIIVIVVNLAVDLCVAMLNPRLRA